MNIVIVGDTNDFTTAAVAGVYARKTGAKETKSKYGHYIDETTKVHGTRYKVHATGLHSLHAHYRCCCHWTRFRDRCTVYNPKEDDVGKTHFLYRMHGVAVVFDVARVGPEGPQRWIALIRGAHAEMPIVCCGVFGLLSDARLAEDAEYRAVCESAGVEYFAIDCRVDNGEALHAIEALTGKAAVHAVYTLEEGSSAPRTECPSAPAPVTEFSPWPIQY